MKTALIFGLSARHIHCLKPLLPSDCHPDRDDWKVLFFPAPTGRNTLALASVGKFLQTAADQPNVHILGFHSPTKDLQRNKLAELILPYFRFRWLENLWLGRIVAGGAAAFLDALLDVFEEEDFWEAHIKPSEVSSPLCLPEVSFATRTFHSLWRNSQIFGDRSAMEGVPTQLERFRARHHRRERDNLFWKDDEHRRFVYNGARHGTADFPSNWKFSFCLDRGFHYDVSHADGKAFRVRTAGAPGETFARANGYLNIDPHGNPR